MIISIHSHNDRGTGVATSEMALLAGGERIEGALLGNGERTGNADILNIAMNMYVLGVDPKLDFSNMKKLKEMYEKYIKIPISPRHPYIGELVFTAFSGSHQDAISKGLHEIKKNKSKYWEVPYLPLDPADVNRQYEPIIRINSQSGKGGVAFLLEQEYGFLIPKEMQKEIGYFIKNTSDAKKRELNTQEIYEAFEKEYINRKDKIQLIEYNIKSDVDNNTVLDITLNINNENIKKQAKGNGPVDALIKILKEMGYQFQFKSYNQDSQEEAEEESSAITYIKLETAESKEIWAIGKDESIVKSSFDAIICAINRMDSNN